MAVSKSDISKKREKRREKQERIEHLTNWYMINLSWGVAGLIALGFVESAYANAATILTAPIVMRILGAVFLLGAALVFVLGKSGVIKNTKRAIHYSVFLLVTSAVSFWIGFYTYIRNVVVAVIPSLSALRSEWWFVWSFRYILVAYLLVAFIVVTVKTTRAEKNR